MTPRLAAAILGLLVGTAPSFAAAGDPGRGKDLAALGNPVAAVPACSGCHGAQGQGQAEAGIPRIAGLNGTYLDHQLTAFGSGERNNAIMTPIARMLDPAARADVAAYYAGLLAPATGDAAPAAGGAATLAAGETIALRGVWSANVPACASCHGRRGLGVGASFPAIAGQSATYIANQLRDWKSGERHGGPLGLMTGVAGHLDDAQAAAVSAYYASLPPTVPRPTAKNEAGKNGTGKNEAGHE